MNSAGQKSSEDGGISSDNGNKLWERPWSTNEMREKAQNWNLAADSGLLKHLQEFSQTVLSRTHATEKSLDSLIEDINVTATNINNINNGFLCLANTQFVENRVYDDDDKETPQEAPCAEKQSREETEAAMLKRVREALSMSVAVLDTMFEPVELQASDSEGEMEDDLTSGNTLLLEPHNPYYHRQLPHLIGTEAFMSDDRIGLGDSPSDSEEQPVDDSLPIDIDASSDSDFDSFVPGSKRGRETGSFQDSDSNISDDQSKSGQKKQKKASVPFQPSNHTDEDSIHKSGPEGGSGASGTDISFAAQLAAKLGGVAAAAAAASASSESASEAAPQRTKQTAPTKAKEKSDDLFGRLSSDEEDDLFSGHHGLFSSRPKRFDDLGDTSNSLWAGTPHFDEKPTPTVNNVLPTSKPKQPMVKAVDDLFGSSPQDEDDLFFSKAHQHNVTNKNVTPILGLGANHSRTRPVLSTGELDPGVATSTPTNNTKVESNSSQHGEKKSIDLFGDVSEHSGEISKINEHVLSGGIAVGNNADQPAGPSETQKKKPAGGKLMFGPASVGLLGGLKEKLPPRPQSSSSSSSSVASDEEKPNTSHSSSGVPNSAISSVIVSSRSSGLGTTHDSLSQGSVANVQSQPENSAAFQPPHTSTQLRRHTDDDGYGTKTLFPSHRNNTADEDLDDLFNTTSNILPKTQSNASAVAGGLFAGIEDEDDLFSEAAPGKSNFSSGKSSNLIISNSVAAGKSDALFTDSRTKPDINVSTKDSSSEVDGGFSASKLSTEKHETPGLFNSNDRDSSENFREDRVSSKTSSSVASFPEIPKRDLFSKDPPPIKSENKPKKTLSLFDESDSGEDELLFSSASSAGSRRSQASGDLLASAANTSSEKRPLSKKGLFDDDDALFGSARNDPDVDLFSDTTKSSLPAKYVHSHHQEEENRLSFKDQEISKTSQKLISDLSKPGTGPPVRQENHDNIRAPSLSANPIAGSSAESKPSMTVDSLFDDADDDLFSTNRKPSVPTKSVVTSGSPEDLFSDSTHKDQYGKTSSSSQFVPQGDPVLSPPNVSQAALFSDAISNYESKHPKPSTVHGARSQETKDSSETLSVTDTSSKNNIVDDEKGDLFSDQSRDTNYYVSGNKSSDSRSSPSPAIPTKPRKPEPPKTLDIRKTTDPSLRDDDEDDDDDSLFKSIVPPSRKDLEFKKSSVKGFGTHPALNIDPRALLPGAKPPPRKNASDDNSRPEQNVTDINTPSFKSQVIASVKEERTEDSVGFDQPIVNNATLPSAVKDRAKLGVKRRPPSNKARREAARASWTLDSSDTDNSPFPSGGIDTAVNEKFAPETPLSPVSNILSPSTDEDDLFGVPQDLPAEYGKQHVASSDIFSDAPIISPLAPDKKTDILFPSKTDTLFTSVKKDTSVEKGLSSNEVCGSESPENHDILNLPGSSTFSKGNTVLQKESNNSLRVCSESERGIDKEPHETTSVQPSGISPQPVRDFKPELAAYQEKEQHSCIVPETESNLFSGDDRSQAPSISGNGVTCSSSETSLPQAVGTSSPENTHLEAPIAGTEVGTQRTSMSDSNKKHFSDKESKKGLLANIQAVDTDPLKGTETRTSPPVSPEEEELFSNTQEANHSSLFAFVKKKPEIKNEPLFSKAPSLPTKENERSKTKIGLLADDDDDDDLFLPTKAPPVKKPDVRQKEGADDKKWHLSDDDDDDDLFLQSPKSKKVLPSQDSSSSTNANFSVAQKTKSLSSTETKKLSSKVTTKTDLFGDENEDDDLFSKPSPLVKDKLKQNIPNRTSLFDDGDDNLFGSPSSFVSNSNVETKGTPSNQKKVPASSGVKSANQTATKLKPENVFDDPLMAMQKDN